MSLFHVVVLAAGQGTRLRPFTTDHPKCMLPVGIPQRPMLHRLLHQLVPQFPELCWHVVVGHCADQITWPDDLPAPHSDWKIVNEDYKTTNNMVSCQLALDTIPPGAHVIVINGDIYFHEDDMVRDMWKYLLHRLNNGKSTVWCDPKRHDDPESMKLRVEAGYVVELSKTLTPDKSYGASLDCYALAADGVRHFHDAIKTHRQKGMHNDWFEMALNATHKQIRFEPTHLDHFHWAEIDQLNDLCELSRSVLLSEIRTRPESVLLIDLDGTVLRQHRLLDGVGDAVNKLRGYVQEVCFVSNNTSRTADEFAVMMRSQSPLLSWVTGDHIVTPLEEVQRYVKLNNFKNPYVFGNPVVRELFASLDTAVDHDVVILCHHTSYTYRELCDLIVLLQEQPDVALVATHSDMLCPFRNKTFVPDVGLLLHQVEVCTGRKPSVIFGKPNLPARFRNLPCWVVGDNGMTDQALARAFGFPFVLVLSGRTITIPTDIPNYILNSLADLN